MSTPLRIVLCLLAAAVVSGCAGATAAQPSAELKTQNFIVLVLDGERWTETWGDADRANIPQRAKLAKQGVLCTNFRNDGKTSTVPGHTAICTGHYQKMANDGSALPDHPSFMQVWLAASGEPADKAWVIASKGKLNVLADCADPAWKGRANPSTDCNQGDRDTVDIIKKTLTDKHPRLMVVNIKDPDSRGHANDWEGYLKAIRTSDSYVAEVWQHLQADPFYKDKTALFVTNDHGRHSDGVNNGFVGHGGDCDGCRHVQLLAVGPDFAKGKVSDKAAGQIDIAATIAHMLGVKLPASKGRVLTELFAPAPTSQVYPLGVAAVE